MLGELLEKFSLDRLPIFLIGIFCMLNNPIVSINFLEKLPLFGLHLCQSECNECDVIQSMSY